MILNSAKDWTLVRRLPLLCRIPVFLSAITCECDLDLCHFELDQAFVQSDLEEDAFLQLSKDMVSFQARQFESTNACVI